MPLALLSKIEFSKADISSCSFLSSCASGTILFRKKIFINTGSLFYFYNYNKKYFSLIFRKTKIIKILKKVNKK